MGRNPVMARAPPIALAHGGKPLRATARSWLTSEMGAVSMNANVRPGTHLGNPYGVGIDRKPITPKGAA